MSLLRAALLATVVAAGEVDKEACSQRLLQIDSSIHEADHNCHDGHDGCSSSRTEVLSLRPQGQMTLLQVAAKTGEVAQYLPRDNDEEAPSSQPASRKGASDKKEKNHAINSLLARGSGAQEPEEEEEKEKTESRSKSSKSKSNEEAQGTERDIQDKERKEAEEEEEEKEEKKEKEEQEEKEEKPKRRIVIDEEKLEKSNANNNNDDRKAEKANNNNDDKAERESADLERSADNNGALEDVPQGARIAPFGKEDTARELQHHAARTQDTLVDAIENAEVAEIKRSIFRSLTRLRAAEIKEFDTIARLETQAIDEYNDNHHYRSENPLDYIHSAEVKVKEDKFTSFHD